MVVVDLIETYPKTLCRVRPSNGPSDGWSVRNPFLENEKDLLCGNYWGGLTLTLLNVLGVLGVLNVLNVLFKMCLMR